MCEGRGRGVGVGGGGRTWRPVAGTEGRKQVGEAAVTAEAEATAVGPALASWPACILNSLAE